MTNGKNYVVESTLVHAGALNITDVPGSNNFTFCRVLGSIPYGTNDTINFEVWLPSASEYNERYLSVGEYTSNLSLSIDY